MRLTSILIVIAALAGSSVFCLEQTTIADPTTKPSAASMGSYKGMFNGAMATLDLKDDQVAMLSSMMPDATDKSKMVDTKSEGKWTLEDQTVTIQMITINGQPVGDDDAMKKIKLTVDDHGDKLVGNDKISADLKRQSS